MTDSSPETHKTKTAVVTGRHPFDVPGFHAVFRSSPAIDFYPQHMEDFVKASEEVRRQYDVVVFYNMHMETPGNEQSWWETGMKEALEALGETEQGVFVLHHALLAFPQWQLWSDIVGIQDRSFGYHIGGTVRVQIADRNHPISQGLNDWEMIDETYTMEDAGEGSEILLTIDHPKSMRTIGWTRQYQKARVFCLQSGHDNQTYVNPNFRTVVCRAIQWCAGKL